MTFNLDIDGRIGLKPRPIGLAVLIELPKSDRSCQTQNEFLSTDQMPALFPRAERPKTLLNLGSRPDGLPVDVCQEDTGDFDEAEVSGFFAVSDAQPATINPGRTPCVLS